MDIEDENILIAVFTVVIAAYYLLFNDDEEEENEIAEAIGGDRQIVTKINNYVEITIPRLNGTQFREHFRMTRATFEKLQITLAPFILGNEVLGRPQIDITKQILVALWVLANKEAFRSIGERFGITKSTAWTSMKRVCYALINHNNEEGVVRWPNAARTRTIVNGFRANNRGFPGVVGAIDGCHIPIQAPQEHAASYINRKNFHSILLQGVCDHEMLFIDVYVGEVGSIHDACMFRRSDLFNRIQTRDIKLEANMHMIGDPAYPISTYMMVAYKNFGNQTRKQKNFNTTLSQSRSVIERAFALLKGRFRRLKYLEMARIELIPQVVLACCILHNICLLEEDFDWLDVNIPDDFDVEDMVVNNAAEIRDLRNERRQNRAGMAKRNIIANTLYYRGRLARVVPDDGE